MASRRTDRRPSLESLERKVALSTSVPLNTIAIVPGNVAAGQLASTPVEISPEHFAGRRASTILNVAVGPLPGSTLVSKIVAAIDANGHKLQVRLEAPFSARHGQANAMVYDKTPGTISIIVAGSRQSSGSFNTMVTLPGDVNGSGHVNINDTIAFSPAYATRISDPYYNNAADANQNGYIGIGDAKLLLRNLTPYGPKRPLKLTMQLAPRDQVIPVQGSISGGETYHSTVTVEGKTTPGSIVFRGAGFGNFTFSGTAIPTNSKGFFAYTDKLATPLTANNILVVDPYGQSLVHVFPILRLKA